MPPDSSIYTERETAVRFLLRFLVLPALLASGILWWNSEPAIYRLTASASDSTLVVCPKGPVPVRPTPLPLVPDDEFRTPDGLPGFSWQGRICRNPGSIARLIWDRREPEAVRRAALGWLETQLTRVGAGSREADLLRYDYEYPFDYTVFPAGFASAWAQAEWCRSARSLWQEKPNEATRNRYRRALYGLLVPQQEGGILFQSGKAIWFEELGDLHILNAQLDALDVLLAGADDLADEVLRSVAQAGLETLIAWLPRYDTGNWSRYDLGWNRYEVMFSLTLCQDPGRSGAKLQEIYALTPHPAGTRAVALGLTGLDAWTGSCRLLRQPFPLHPLSAESSAILLQEEASGDGLIFSVTFPPPACQPAEDGPRPALAFDVQASAPVRLCLAARDRSYYRVWRFRREGELACPGDGKTHRLEISLPLRVLDRGIAARYQWKHVLGLESLAARTGRSELADGAARFRAYIENGSPRDWTEAPALQDTDAVALDRLRVELGSNKRPRELDDIWRLASAFKQHFRLGICSSADLAGMIQGRILQCGDAQRLFLHLLLRLGIPARAVDLHNFPRIGEGHCALEFWWRGKWRYFDPSYGFFVAPDDGRDPVSFAELRADPSLAERWGRRAMGELWPPKQRPGSDGGEWANADIYTSMSIFRDANPAGPTGPYDPLRFPLLVPPEGRRIGEVAAVADWYSQLDCVSGPDQPGLEPGLFRIGRAHKAWEIELRFPPAPAKGKSWQVLLHPASSSGPGLQLVAQAGNGSVTPPVRPINFVGPRPGEPAPLVFDFLATAPRPVLRLRLADGVCPAVLSVDAWEIRPAD